MITVYLGSFLAINCGEQLLADLLYFEFLQVFIVILRPSTFIRGGFIIFNFLLST